MRSEEELLAEIYREFREGLPERLDRMRAALEGLVATNDEEAAQLFYRTAHSLKGTAASFEATELVQPATTLAAIGLPWYEGVMPQADEIEAAFRGLEVLGEAVRQYSVRMEGDVSR
jgi:HPt (histidine-containing phosphotransfer) domain-containing protein